MIIFNLVCIELQNFVFRFQIFNNSQMMDLFVVRNQYESLHLDSHFDMNPPVINSSSEAELIFNFPRYMKGNSE